MGGRIAETDRVLTYTAFFWSIQTVILLNFRSIRSGRFDQPETLTDWYAEQYS